MDYQVRRRSNPSPLTSDDLKGCENDNEMERNKLSSPVHSPNSPQSILDSPDSRHSNADSADRSSPENHCAICLSRLENKSFTDSCFHQFCFTCLLEWSKVKAECPLCKQSFKSIIHNVRSIEDYDQYYISGRTDGRTVRSPDGRRFRYPSTLTTERRRQMNYEQSFDNYRQTYAPHLYRGLNARYPILNRATSSDVRRRIYENGEWVRIQGDGAILRYRETSPEFYRQNPACTHRLIPWLNRELIALLLNSENQVAFVLELILALIMRYGIRSEEFYEHILPYLQDRTSHFIHEFYNFARSIYDMSTYDEHAQYDRLENLQGSSNTSSPSSIIEVPIERFLNRNNISRGEKTTSQSSSSGLDMPSSSTRDSLEDLAVPGPSGTASIDSPSDICYVNSPNIDNNHYDSDTEDECIIVGYMKPKFERTPEMVDIVSSSDDEEETDSSKRKLDSSERPLRRARVDYHYDYSSDSCSDRKEVLKRKASILKVKIKSFLGAVYKGQVSDSSEDKSERSHHGSHKKHKKHKKHKSHKHRHRHHKRESRD